MSATSSDIVWRLSNPGAPRGDLNDQPDPNGSLGGYVSTTPWTGGSIADLFDAVTGLEDEAMTVDYRCVFIAMKAATPGDIAFAGQLWIEAQVEGGADLDIGLDPLSLSEVIPIASNNPQAAIIGNELTPPEGVVFSRPTEVAPLLVGDLADGLTVAVWIRRTASGSGPLSLDGATLVFKASSTPPSP